MLGMVFQSLQGSARMDITALRVPQALMALETWYISSVLSLNRDTVCVHKELNSFIMCDLQIESTGNNMCPPGHYCPTGISSPLPCPAGTFSSSPGLSGAEQCQPCPPGYFCEQTAMIHPSEATLCDAG